jgi:sigma-E factor negative regulatory protein RseA
MHEDLNQKISQFLDNELNQDETLSILQKIQADSELINKMNRYEAISHVLKTDVFLYTNPDFSAKVNQQIQNEPIYLLPRNHVLAQKNPFTRNNKIIALAASLAVMTIITTQGINYSDNKPKPSSTIQLAEQKVVAHSSKKSAVLRQNEQYPLNARINDYLQAHNNSVYTSGEANFRPFTTVSVHSQE